MMKQNRKLVLCSAAAILILLVFAPFVMAKEQEIIVPGQNAYLDPNPPNNYPGYVYIPWYQEHSGLLNTVLPGGYVIGKVNDRITSPGTYTGWINLYLKFDLSGKLKEGQSIGSNPYMVLNLKCFNFAGYRKFNVPGYHPGDIYSYYVFPENQGFYSSVNLLLIDKGPANPAHPPIGYSPPNDAPSLEINGTNYAKFNARMYNGIPQTNLDILAYDYVKYKIYFNDFIPRGGKSISEVIKNINADKEFTLYVTLKVWNITNPWPPGYGYIYKWESDIDAGNFSFFIPLYEDIGLRVYDGGAKPVAIAAEPYDPSTPPSSPLRVSKENGKVYGIALVDRADSMASGVTVQTKQGIKALRKLEE